MSTSVSRGREKFPKLSYSRAWLCSLPSIETAEMTPAAKEKDTGIGDMWPPPIRKSLVSLPRLLYQCQSTPDQARTTAATAVNVFLQDWPETSALRQNLDANTEPPIDLKRNATFASHE
ncbi:hypothetical protein E2C01_055725 [Portunus trituberculatus]|uniref:Uncharacterized protein n=1 Tax=Portunus trituberculatus TaxID=210409 RepID=A0A5B7GNH7_PORTR|nr:hypothetical protein [Portunus trituberculatus]